MKATLTIEAVLKEVWSSLEVEPVYEYGILLGRVATRPIQRFAKFITFDGNEITVPVDQKTQDALTFNLKNKIEIKIYVTSEPL